MSNALCAFNFSLFFLQGAICTLPPTVPSCPGLGSAQAQFTGSYDGVLGVRMKQKSGFTLLPWTRFEPRTLEV